MQPSLDNLMTAIVSLQNPAEAHAFFADLCTPAELTALADRWKVAQLLDQGVAYRTIYARTGVSTATVTRVARALSHGEGGYLAVLRRPQRPSEASDA